MTAVNYDTPAKLAAPSGSISQPASSFDVFVDRSTRRAARAFAIAMILLIVVIVGRIAWAAFPAFQTEGWKLFGNKWDTRDDFESFGLRPSILGTIYSSGLALIVATIFGVSIAIFLSQNFIPKKLEILFKNIVELLAAVPSVVYGFWGAMVVVPLLRDGIDWMYSIGEKVFPSLKNNHGRLSGTGMLPAVIVLAIMVLPTISAISYDALVSVNPKIKEAAYGLGATRWEAILKVILPTASVGIFGSIILGFGRALGETMALAMLLGNKNSFSLSLFERGNTLASLIANTWNEASDNAKSALLFAGLMLLVITLAVNIAGAAVVQYTNRGRAGARQ